MSIFTIAIFLIAASQFYWAWRFWRLLRKWVRQPGRTVLAAVVLAVYLVLWYINFGDFRGSSPVHLTLAQALLVAPFMTWAISSLVGAIIALLFAIPQSMVGLGRWIARKRGGDKPASPERRVFLARTAGVVTTAIHLPSPTIDCGM